MQLQFEFACNFKTNQWETGFLHIAMYDTCAREYLTHYSQSDVDTMYLAKKCTPGQRYWLLSYIKISYAQNRLLSYITVKLWENFMILFTRDNKFMMRHWLSWKMFLLCATYKLLISHKIFLFFLFFYWTYFELIWIRTSKYTKYVVYTWNAILYIYIM